MPLKKRRQRGAETPPNPPSDVPLRGVIARLTGSSTVSWHADNPEALMASLMTMWYQHQPAAGTWDVGIDNDIIASVEDADTNDYWLWIRAMCGADAPIGRPGTSRPSWMFNHATYPVGRIRLLDNEQLDEEIFVPDWLNSWSYNSTTARYEPVPGSSAANYFHWYEGYLTHLRDLLSVNISAGNPRFSHVHGIHLAAPTESGTEMTLGYRSNANFTGAATLAYAITAGATTATLQGSSGYPSSGLAKILDANGNSIRGFELIHYTSMSGPTITIGRRGHSGTNAASHGVGVQIQYASGNTITTTYNNYGPAPYDHRTVDQTAWDSISTGSTATALQTYRRERTRYAWAYCIDLHMDILQNPIHAALTYGHTFYDKSIAKDLITNAGAKYGRRVIGKTTSLKENYHTTNPSDDDFIHQAINSGALVGQHTAQPSLFPAGPGMMETFEEALAHYVDGQGNKVMYFMEMHPSIFSSTTRYTLYPYLGWTGSGQYTMKEYLLTAPGNFQSRLPEAPG